jgi:hypothetical protein
MSIKEIKEMSNIKMNIIITEKIIIKICLKDKYDLYNFNFIFINIDN